MGRILTWAFCLVVLFSTAKQIYAMVGFVYDGGWYYHNNPALSAFGTVNVNSAYTDLNGVAWNTQ